MLKLGNQKIKFGKDPVLTLATTKALTNDLINYPFDTTTLSVSLSTLVSTRVVTSLTAIPIRIPS